MKKLLAIIVLGLLWSGNAYAEQIKFKCLIYAENLKNFAYKSRQELNGKIIDIEIDTNKKIIKHNSRDDSLYTILGIDTEVKYDLEKIEKPEGNYKTTSEIYRYNSEVPMTFNTSDGTKEMFYIYAGQVKRFKLNDEYQKLRRSLHIFISSQPRGNFLNVDLKCPDRDITQVEIANAKEDMLDNEKKKIYEKKFKKEVCMRKHTTNQTKYRKCLSKIK